MNAAPTSGAADALASLAAAADAARQAYMAALRANPAADLSVVYIREMAALEAWSSATEKALTANPAVTAAQKALDTATSGIRGDLATVSAVGQWVTRLDNLVKLATKLASYFA
jgi:hypothetical protein